MENNEAARSFSSFLRWLFVGIWNWISTSVRKLFTIVITFLSRDPVKILIEPIGPRKLEDKS